MNDTIDRLHIVEKFERHRLSEATGNIESALVRLVGRQVEIERELVDLFASFNLVRKQKPVRKVYINFKYDKHNDFCLGPSTFKYQGMNGSESVTQLLSYFRSMYQDEIRYIAKQIKSLQKQYLKIRATLRQVLLVINKAEPAAKAIHHKHIKHLSRSEYSGSISREYREAFMQEYSSVLSRITQHIIDLEDDIDECTKGLANKQKRRNGMIIYSWQSVKCDLTRVTGPHLMTVKFIDGDPKLYRTKNQNLTKALLKRLYHRNPTVLYELGRRVKLLSQSRNEKLACLLAIKKQMKEVERL